METGLFPLGEASFSRRMFCNYWKRFAFTLHTLQSDLIPRLGIRAMMQHWTKIDDFLKDSPRQRHAQLEDAWEEYYGGILKTT